MSDELLVAEIHAASVRREQRSMLARTARKTTLPVIAAAIVVVAWEIAVDASGIKPAVLPAPSGVLSATFANRDILIANALPTTLETIAGFILSLSLGGLLGVLLTYFALVRDALYPNVILFQLIPKVAVAPLFMLWLGIGWESRVAMALFIAFFPIVISTVSGLQAADPAILRLCESSGCKPLAGLFQGPAALLASVPVQWHEDQHDARNHRGDRRRIHHLPARAGLHHPVCRLAARNGNRNGGPPGPVHSRARALWAGRAG